MRALVLVALLLGGCAPAVCPVTWVYPADNCTECGE